MKNVACCVSLLMGAVLLAGTSAGSSRAATRVEGIIAEVDATAQQIFLQSEGEELAVQVTPNTIITMKLDPIAFEGLKVGMTVVVCGVVDDGLLYAEKINVKYLGK